MLEWLTDRFSTSADLITRHQLTPAQLAETADAVQSRRERELQAPSLSLMDGMLHIVVLFRHKETAARIAAGALHKDHKIVRHAVRAQRKNQRSVTTSPA